MSLIFHAPALAVDVGITILHGFVGCCWLVVVYRMVSLGGQLALLSLPSTFPHYPSLSSASTAKEYWLSLGAEFFFAISLLEVVFSLYCLHLIRRARAMPAVTPRPLQYLTGLIIYALGSGLQSEPSSSSSPQGTSEHQKKEPDQDVGIPPSTHFMHKPLAFDDPKAIDFRNNHSIWFQSCRWEDIYRENHLEWLCAVLLNKSLTQVKEEDKHKSKEEAVLPHLHKLVVAYEKRVGTRMPEGYNEQLGDTTMKLFIDPIRVTHRPLTLSYGFAWTSNEIIRQVLRFKGFTLKSCSNRKNALKYFIRIPDAWKELPSDQRPPAVLFIHGIGMGFLLYTTLIHYLAFSEWGNQRPVMIFVQPHISMEIFSPAYFLPPDEPQLVGDVKEAFDRMAIHETGIEILAHSNGTVVAGWIIKAFPELVKRSCLLDPICFALWEGHLCYNFLYSKPKTGLQKLLRFGMADELGIAFYTRRRFSWPDAVLWPHQVPGFRDPKRFVVLLAGKDDIINASRTRRYLLDAGMTDAFPMPPADIPNSSQQDSRPLIQVEIDRQDSSPARRRTTRTRQQIGTGGIIFDPESAHGQTLLPGHPYFKAITGWLEGKGIRLKSHPK